MSHNLSDIRIPGLEVASRLGDLAFWVQVPTQAPDGTMLNTPYLVKMDTIVAGTIDVRLRAGDRVTVEGIVHEMTDSVLADWTAAGAIHEGNRIEAEFASSFLQASVVELPRPSGGAAPNDG